MKTPPNNVTSSSRIHSGLSRRESHAGWGGLDWAEVRLRNFKPSDLDVLVQIDSLCFPEVIAYNKEHMKEYLRHRSATALVVEYGRQTIGFALVVHHTRENRLHLVTLDIIPQYQGLGVGRWLLGAVLQMAVSVKAVKIQLEVAATNQKAIDLYRTFGFRITRTLKKYYADGTDGFFMVLSRLGPESTFGYASNENKPIICDVLDSGERCRYQGSSCT